MHDNLNILLGASRELGPKRRFRGKRRYFRRVLADAQEFSLGVGPGPSCEFWHYHADWPGWGNRSWRYRRQHLEALTVFYGKIEAGSQDFKAPFQAWLYVSGRDAGEDAVYLHAPGKNGVFPFAPDGVEWGASPMQAAVEKLFPDTVIRVGLSRAFDEHAEPARVTQSLFVYCPGVGTPLERA